MKKSASKDTSEFKAKPLWRQHEKYSAEGVSAPDSSEGGWWAWALGAGVVVLTGFVLLQIRAKK